METRSQNKQNFGQLRKYNRGIFLSKSEFIWNDKFEEGGNAKVYCVISKWTGETYAIKQISLETPRELLQKQLRFSLLNHHPFICLCWDAFVQGDFVYIVMQYCNNSLRDHLKHLEPKTYFQSVRTCLLQITQALAYLHSKNIVHRDIKVDNILIKGNGSACLCDFGSADDRKGAFKEEFWGVTTIYCPPEVFSGEYGLSGDIWALGQLAFQLITGKQVFQDDDQWKTKVRQPIDFAANTKLTIYWRTLLENILKIKPKERMSLQRIKEYLRPKSEEIKALLNESQVSLSTNQLEVSGQIPPYFEYVKEEFLKSLQFVPGTVLPKDQFVRQFKRRFKIDANNIIHVVSKVIKKEINRQALSHGLHQYNKKRKAFIGISFNPEK